MSEPGESGMATNYHSAAQLPLQVFHSLLPWSYKAYDEKTVKVKFTHPKYYIQTFEPILVPQKIHFKIDRFLTLQCTETLILYLFYPWKNVKK